MRDRRNRRRVGRGRGRLPARRARWPPPPSPRPSARRPATTPPPTSARVRWSYRQQHRRRWLSRVAGGQPARVAQRRDRVRPRRADRQPRDPAAGLLPRPADLRQRGRRLDLRQSWSPTSRSTSCAIFSYERFKGLLAVRQPMQSRRWTMNPSRRSQLREDLRAAPTPSGWTALVGAARHAAAGARSPSGRAPVPAADAAAARASGCTTPSRRRRIPSCCTTIAVVRRRLRRRHERRSRSPAAARAADGPAASTPIRSRSPPTSTTPTRRASARSSSTTLVEAQKFAGRPADIELLVRLAFRNPAAKSDLSSKFGVDPADAELLVKHVLAAGVRFAGFSFHVGSQSSSAEPYRDGAARHPGPRRAHRRDARCARPHHRHRRRVSRQLPRADARPSTTIADIIDEVLGADAGRRSRCSPNRAVSSPRTA